MIAELKDMMVSSGLNKEAFAVGEPLSISGCTSCMMLCMSCWMISVVT